MKITDKQRLNRLLRYGVTILVMSDDTKSFGGYWLNCNTRKDIDTAIRAERKKKGGR